MCVSKGAPKKPAYGPCNETHGRQGYVITGRYYSTGGYYGGISTATTTSAANTFCGNYTTTAAGWTTV